MSDHKEDKSHGAPPKKTLGARLVGIGISILMLLVFMYFLRSTFPQVLVGAAGVINDSGLAFGDVGQSFTVVANGIRKFAMGFRLTLLEILNVLITAVLLGWLISVVVGFAPGRKKKDDDHHPPGDAGHH
jgi:hypothetical protein